LFSSNAAHLHYSLGIYSVHRDFWVPYVTGKNLPIPSETVSPHLFDFNWINPIKDAVPVFHELFMICACALLDKKYHRVRTGRKFFTAELSSARPKSE
jgi:hypothetical protein